MVPGYEEVLLRLSEERTRQNISQANLCGKIGITQSHYSKVEHGLNYFSYEQLKILNTMDMDLHFIFTGNRSRLSDYPRLQALISPADYCFVGQFFYVQVERICDLQAANETYKELSRQIKVMRYILNSGKQNFWRLLRYYYECSQETLAGQLDVDYKKYSGLETGKRYPNSEMVYLLYKNFCIPPQFVLGDDRGIMRALCDVMEKLSEEERNKIINMFEFEKETFG